MSVKALKVVIAAASGRMGSCAASLAASDPRFALKGCVFHGVMGNSFGAPAFRWEDLSKALEGARAVVDFSTPEASLRVLSCAVQARAAAVIGTTGFSAVQSAQIVVLSRKVPVFLSPNFSRGAAVVERAARQAAVALDGYDAAILEIHHKAKKDAPSGTAMRLAKALKEVRPDGDVPIVSQRLGGVVGDHVVILAGPRERIEIIHRAHSRELFAQGALDAALWLSRKKPGLYGMADWV
ncbi:MAG: 4-hydroxy-tetrahydrodipicolinate reductase [Elusimicrobiota bacterium]